MFDSKLKLQGLSLEEIIHEGIHGNNPEVSVDDWKFMEHLMDELTTIDNECAEEYDEEVVKLPMQSEGSVSLIQDDWTEDDSELPETLEVVLAQDSDIHIRTVDSRGGLLRFRNMIGGGRYPNTYFALRNLYDAMQEDKNNPNGSWVDASNRYMRDK